MIAIGFGVAWLGYAVVSWGYCLIRDYNVTFGDLFKATWPGAVSAAGPGTVSSQVVPSPTGQPTVPSQLTGQ
jgi:hypothetical protein